MSPGWGGLWSGWCEGEYETWGLPRDHWKPFLRALLSSGTLGKGESQKGLDEVTAFSLRGDENTTAHYPPFSHRAGPACANALPTSHVPPEALATFPLPAQWVPVQGILFLPLCLCSQLAAQMSPTLRSLPRLNHSVFHSSTYLVSTCLCQPPTGIWAK